jgi:hypothetical protein
MLASGWRVPVVPGNLLILAPARPGGNPSAAANVLSCSIILMSSDYRLAPAIAARLMGVFLVGVALLVLATRVVVALIDAPPIVLLVVAVLGVASVVGAGYLLNRRAYVVRLDAAGYRVRLVRGAGVREARWVEVEEAVTGSPRGLPCVILRLRDGRSTTIPVQALAGEPEAFVRDVRAHLGSASSEPPSERA